VLSYVGRRHTPHVYVYVYVRARVRVVSLGEYRVLVARSPAVARAAAACHVGYIFAKKRKQDFYVEKENTKGDTDRAEDGRPNTVRVDGFLRSEKWIVRSIALTRLSPGVVRICG